jgi:hypothetical protein
MKSITKIIPIKKIIGVEITKANWNIEVTSVRGNVRRMIPLSRRTE